MMRLEDMFSPNPYPSHGRTLGSFFPSARGLYYRRDFYVDLCRLVAVCAESRVYLVGQERRVWLRVAVCIENAFFFFLKADVTAN